MAFSKGDKVKCEDFDGTCEIAAGPDVDGDYCIASPGGSYNIYKASALSPLPRTLAEVEPGVACRHISGQTVFRDRCNLVLGVGCNGSIYGCIGHPGDWDISEVFGPVKTVIEGRE